MATTNPATAIPDHVQGLESKPTVTDTGIPLCVVYPTHHIAPPQSKNDQSQHFIGWLK